MIQPGFYKHFGGGTYTVLFTAKDSTNGRADGQMVVYVSHTYGTISVRDLWEFEQPVLWPDGKMHPRFMRWEEPTPPVKKPKDVLADERRREEYDGLRRDADAAWARGDKSMSSMLHDKAHKLLASSAPKKNNSGDL